MSYERILKKFSQQWVIANTAIWSVSFALTSFVHFALSIGVKPAVEYNMRVTATYVSFAVGNVVIGLVQWLVLRRQVLRISIWWILTSIPGLHTGVFVGFFSAFYIMNHLFNIGFAGYVQMFIGSIVAGAVGGLIGGAVTGVAQFIFLIRRITLTRLWIIWILTSAVAWAVGWSTGCAMSSFVGLAAGNAVSPSLANEVSVVVFGLMFGIISGFLNGVVTGKVLVWALRRSRIDGTANTANHT
ncbi:hypothetical protein [Scytonema sp. NUACC26]|uniref:hypothetical protein n=1 Tax=Scytonema sp. NUACC26 TaxID=3140176 RepID=UPI0034DCB2CF